MAYQSIFPLSDLPESAESEATSQPFSIALYNPFHRTDDLFGISELRYHRMNEIVGGVVYAPFHRLGD